MRSIFLCLLISFAAGAAEPGFTEIVIDAGFRVEQPVLVARLTYDGSTHIVLAGRDDGHQQHLAVFRLGNAKDYGAELVLSLTPHPNLIAYDVGRVGDRDALFFIEPGRVLRYDFAIGELAEFTKIRTIYGQERVGEIVPIDFFRDVNGDERDDLIVRDTAGYRLRLQHPDRNFGDEIVLQESSSMTVSGGIVSFESRPLFNGDINFDGLTDLAVWRGDSLRVYLQLPDERFDGEPQALPLGLGLPTEAETRALRTGRSAIDLIGLIEKRIWSIQDLNNDQLPDILTETTLSKGVFDKQNDFRLYLGRRDGEQLVYREKEDALLASEGLQYGLITTDIDGDGKQDLLVRKVRLTFARVIRALLSGNVSLQLHFFRMTDDDSYADIANYVTRTNVSFSMSSGQVDIPAIKVADFDADGMQDLMLQTKPDRLSFFHGVPSASLFAEDAVEMSVVLPRNGDLVSAEDINDDGRADLIIRYNAADADGRTNTVRLFVSNAFTVR